MHTIIIGKGNLSNALHKKIGVDKSTLLSSREIIEHSDVLIDLLQQFEQCNIVLNCFQKSTQLYQTTPEILIKNTISNLAAILDMLIPHKHKIFKLIYTSSSAVYGANSGKKCPETTFPAPTSLHGSLKLACEQLISFYCTQHTIEYTITRLFNLFGGQDDFSLIYKLIQAYRNDKPFTLINEGNALRDYIHIDDVVWTYEHLLSIAELPFLNIATGTGISVKEIIQKLEHHGVVFTLNHKENCNEILISEGSNELTEKHIGTHEYISVFIYLLNEISG